MTDDKKFIAALTAAAFSKDMPKASELMRERTQEHIDRMHPTKISALETLCLIAAVMVLDRVYQSSYYADAVELAKEIADSCDVAAIRIDMPAEVGDIND